MVETTRVLTGFRFLALADPEALRTVLEGIATDAGVLGTILVAPEGINLSVAGTPAAIATFSDALRAQIAPASIQLQESPAATARPFRHLRVRLRPEIVAMGRREEPCDFSAASTVAPEDWDRLLADPAIPVIDVRNRYEVAVGHFPGALDPDTASFREFPDWVKSTLDPAQTPEVAMYCTGGIRCTKAAAWMRGQGFRRVHELQGGILAYLAATPAQRSRWQGECFVFDDRVGLVEGLDQGTLVICPGCGQPLDAASQVQADFAATGRCAACADPAVTGRRAARSF